MLINRVISSLSWLVRVAAGLTIIIFCAELTKIENLPSHGVDAEVKPYVDRFLRLGRIIRGEDFDVPPMNIGIGNMRYMELDAKKDETTVGLCNTQLTPINIVFESSYWNDSTDMEREQLVFHELGHCILHREHLNDTLPDGSPSSIMIDHVMHDSTYKSKRNEYILELFVSDVNMNEIAQ